MAKVAEISQEKISYDKVEKVKGNVFVIHKFKQVTNY
jgi:hypothetical protein